MNGESDVETVPRASDHSVFPAAESGSDAPNPTHTTMRDVQDRLQGLRRAMEAGSEYLDPFATARAKDELRRAESRLTAGMGLTVVSLVGGTGSGKSELFNTIAELQFSQVGDLRPTTTQASACVWNADATQVLDVLGVDPRRRIRHDSILTAGDNELDSLVLLDLPDHDSVAFEHSAIVDRLLPNSDVVIWVLDPQKYADHLIHDSYLARMRERKDHMIVVLNQIDLVPESGRQLLLDDVRRLLDEDGLDGVPAYAVSAKLRLGLDDVRAQLKLAVADTASGLSTAVAELDAIRVRLLTGVGASEPDIDGSGLQAATNEIVNASGIPAVAESLRQAGQIFGRPALAKPEQAAASMVAATRDSWLAHARVDLPPLWREAVSNAAPEPEKLRRAISTKVRAVPVPSVPVLSRVVVSVLGILLGLAAIVCAVVGIPSAVLGVRVALAVIGVAVAVGLWVLARRQKASRAWRVAEEYEEAARSAVAQTMSEQLVEPVAKILDQHRRTREALTA